MFVEFDFGVVKGVFRLERQEGEDRTPFDASSDEESSENDPSDGSEPLEEEVDKYDPDMFHLGKSTGASTKHSTWNCRRRGEETKEGEILLGSDSNAYSITFQVLRGFTLKGNLGCDFAPDEFAFTGEKVDVLGDPDWVRISDEWTMRNAASQQRVRVDCWH